MLLGPTLETARLILRPPSAADFDAFAEFNADEDTMRFLGGVQSRSAAWRSLATLIGGWTLRGYSMFSFIEKASGRWVGRGGPWYPDGWPGQEIGWGLAAHARGKGYAQEAARAAIDWAFDTLGWTHVVHCIDPLNAPSIALAQRLGSSLQRRAVSAPLPIVATWDIYGQSREQWSSRSV